MYRNHDPINSFYTIIFYTIIFILSPTTAPETRDRRSADATTRLARECSAKVTGTVSDCDALIEVGSTALY